MNLIVGENDAGKTAIIDAIKLVLTMQSNIERNHTPTRSSTLQSGLKMAYVGMTRPSHMLCEHKDGCKQQLDELASIGWDIHRIFET